MEVSICENSRTPIMDAIREGLEGYSEAYLASAFMTGPGLEPLMDQLTKFAQSKRHRVILVTGGYLDFTSAGALVGLQRLETETNSQARSERVRARMIRDMAAGGFHPKVYLFLGGGKALLLVGSANLTSSGIANNVEAYVRVSGGSEAEVFRTAKQMILEWGGLGEAVTDAAIEEQKAVEERRRAQDELMSILRPILSAEGAASSDDYLRMCEFVRRAEGGSALTPMHKRLLTCARQGRIVEFHLSHSGIWLPLPAQWFNADKERASNDKIHTKTTVDYDIFGKQTADALRKLENQIQYGESQFGWATRRGLFVPDCMWADCETWFAGVKARYEETATDSIGPHRGMLKRAEEGLRDAVEATWRRYNRGKHLPPGLMGDVRGAVATRVREITQRKREAWRFELASLPHPVVGWSAMPAGLTGLQQSGIDTADDVADFALSNLRWLARKLMACMHAGPKDGRAVADVLSRMNVLGLPGISQASASLAEAARQRDAKDIDMAAWGQRRSALARQGAELLDQIIAVSDASGDEVTNWLEEMMGTSPSD